MPTALRCSGSTSSRAIGPPARDLATTRSGAVGYVLMRHLPRRWIDAFLRRRLERLGVTLRAS